MTNPSVRTCVRCLYDARTPGITFDDSGMCNYCRMHDAMDRQYPVGPEGERVLESIVGRMREAGKGKKFDCVVGVSGGCDSSYMLYRMVELGLRPLAVHFDNTWNSPIATQNIYNVLEKLGVELFTIVVNNREYDDLLRAFMLSGVKDIEAPTDIGLAATLYKAAEKYDIQYIIEGHSFRTEGVAPLGWIYMDGKYIESVHRAHGTRSIDSFPNLPLKDFLRWGTLRNIKRIRPLYYMDYHKAEAKELLTRDLGWTWYGGHHLENRFTAFFHTYFLPLRYGIDARLLGHSALVRSGQLMREEAAESLREPVVVDPEILALVKKRLRFSDEELAAVMRSPHKHYSDFQTYKPTFERLRALFWLLYKLDRVPRSFYVKFAFPDPSRPMTHPAKAQPVPETVLSGTPSLHRPK
jgi:N-acetyl sugar amidotransferase